MVNLFAEQEEVHFVVGGVLNLEGLQRFLVLEGASRTFGCFVLVRENLSLDLFIRLLSVFYLVFVLDLDVSQFVEDDVGLLTALEKQLGHVSGLGSELQNVLIIHRHVWLDMVEKECLEQM